ncbi:MAG: VWA domain-containing protein, partial [Dehalococcoidia bacterium]
PTPTPLAPLSFSTVRTQVNPPSQVQFSFSLRDGDKNTLVLPAEEIQAATQIFERGPGTGGWQEIDYSETSFFVHTVVNYALEIVFVLDFTNSMARISLPDGRGGIEAMLDSFRSGLSSLPDAHRVGVVEFHDRNVDPAILSNITTDREAILKAVDDFAGSAFDPGSSRVWDSVETASSLFTTPAANPNVVKALVFFSDGRDTSSLRTRSVAGTIATKLGIQLYAVGVGEVFEEEPLEAMVVATGGAYYPVKDLTRLKDQLEVLVHDLRGQYIVNYITLRRQGSYRTRIQITLKDMAGTFDSKSLNTAAFYGSDSVGRISVDPPSVDRGQALATFFVRAMHVPRNITRFRFKVDTEKPVEIKLIPQKGGGLLEGWEVSGPDALGYHEVSSDTPLEFGNFGLLFQVTISQITRDLVGLPLEFDNSIYSGGKGFEFASWGYIAFQSDRDGNLEIYVMRADGSLQTRLTDNKAEDMDPAWSPDGASIAFSSNRDGDHEIFVMKANGSRQTQLTRNTAEDLYPAWSPDGTLIAFSSKRKGNHEIYVMNADGTKPKRLTNNTAEDLYPAWSPDGTLITFSSKRDGNFEIYTMKADGTEQTRITTNSAEDLHPAWSPDGKLIAFTTKRDGNYEVYVMNPNGSGPTNVTNHKDSFSGPAWSPHGRFLAFDSNKDANYEIYVMGLDNLRPTRVTNSAAQERNAAWQW